MWEEFLRQPDAYEVHNFHPKFKWVSRVYIYFIWDPYSREGHVKVTLVVFRCHKICKILRLVWCISVYLEGFGVLVMSQGTILNFISKLVYFERIGPM